MFKVEHSSCTLLRVATSEVVQKATVDYLASLAVLAFGSLPAGGMTTLMTSSPWLACVGAPLFTGAFLT